MIKKLTTAIAKKKAPQAKNVSTVKVCADIMKLHDDRKNKDGFFEPPAKPKRGARGPIVEGDVPQTWNLGVYKKPGFLPRGI